MVLMMTDHELVRAFVGGSTPAFAELVERHLPVVLAAARRQLSVPHLAEDVSQRVFALLASKAPRLGEEVILAGWLYRAACRVAADTNRSELRRRRREQAAYSAMQDTAPDEIWRAVAPQLDEAMASLSESDRDAVVLRFFENKSLRDVGAALGVSDDAAQKRLARAVERLRGFFSRRGCPVTGAGLMSAMIGCAGEAASPTLTAAIADGALAAAGAGSAGVSAIFVMTHLKSILVGVAALAAAGAAVLEHRQVSRLETENIALRTQAEAGPAASPGGLTTPPASGAAIDPELLRLRGEVARLRAQEKELQRLKAEMARSREVAKAATATGPAEAPNPARDEQRRLGIAKLNFVKRWVLAVILYADANDGQAPRTLQDANPFLPELAGSDDTPNPGPQLDQYELIYQGPLRDVTEPGKMILIREKAEFAFQAPDGVARTYGFVDGHSEIHKFPDDNFAPWEQEHWPKAGLVAPATGGGAKN